MGVDRGKTVLKSIRLNAEDAAILGQEAKAQGLTFNALVSRLVTRFLEWDRFADRYGYIALPTSSFRTLVGLLDDRQLEQFGKDSGSRNAAAIAQFWFKRLDLETFLRFLAISAKYGRIWHYEVARKGGHVVLTIHNDIGPTYAAAHREYFDQAIRQILEVVPTVRQRGDSIVFTFPEPEVR